jgi:hypothetical protein
MLTNALTAKAVANMKDGKHRDGQGLQFEVKGGSRRWTFSYMLEGRHVSWRRQISRDVAG